MKLAVRVAAFTLVLIAAAAGNSLPNPSFRAALHTRAMPSGTPVPMCNPFEHSDCPKVR
jgi:hypothetical protein